MSTITKQHVHVYKPATTTVITYGYEVYRSGKVSRSAASAKDTLMQRKCACGKTVTYDLERFKV